MRKVFVVAHLFGVLVSCTVQADEAAADLRPPLLRSLDGHWTMVGDVRGKPVKYSLVAAPILQGKYSELHMKDVNLPSRYEAKVIIGAGQVGKSMLVHWMDSFGAAYSVPHGSGQMLADGIEFSFPYPGGRFRDVLRKSADSSAWSLKIEAEQADGTWKHFAAYDITPD